MTAVLQNNGNLENIINNVETCGKQSTIWIREVAAIKMYLFDHKPKTFDCCLLYLSVLGKYFSPCRKKLLDDAVFYYLKWTKNSFSFTSTKARLLFASKKSFETGNLKSKNAMLIRCLSGDWIYVEEGVGRVKILWCLLFIEEDLEKKRNFYEIKFALKKAALI